MERADIAFSSDHDKRVLQIENFCLDEIRYYTLWSRVNRTVHFSLQITSLSLAGIVPVLVLIPSPRPLLTAFISAGAWTLAALDQGFSFGENGNRKAITKVALMLELTNFRSRTGKYSVNLDDNTALSIFAERVTELIQTSALKWQKVTENSARHFKPKSAASRDR